MEGTRNEKALIVLSSYVIGFTTAYIAYGITYATFQNDPQLSSQAMTASVAEVIPEQEYMPEVYIDLVDKELSLNVAGESVLLSVKAMDATLSPSKDAVYFCEQQEGSSSCVHYQYVIADEVIKPLDLGVSVDEVILE